jgi:hypothetical protein
MLRFVFKEKVFFFWQNPQGTLFMPAKESRTTVASIYAFPAHPCFENVGNLSRSFKSLPAALVDVIYNTEVMLRNRNGLTSNFEGQHYLCHVIIFLQSFQKEIERGIRNLL